MKHAFLILAHNNFGVVKALLHQLDDPDFDIYIHINAKVKSFPREELEKCLKYANIEFVDRVAIGYCDYSMVQGVMSLFQKSCERFHDYYHLISGADLMIKTRDEFKKFFIEHNGSEFVGFSDSYSEDRVRFKNFYVANCRQQSHRKSVFYIRLRKLLIDFQKIMKLENRPPFEVKKGPDWYSITHAAVKYILQNESRFRKYFYRAYCPTEFLAQTMLYNSSFSQSLYCYSEKSENYQCLRNIDWQRGLPYTYHVEDYDQLISSDAMFARKFDENVDMDVVDRLKYINEVK